MSVCRWSHQKSPKYHIIEIQQGILQGKSLILQGKSMILQRISMILMIFYATTYKWTYLGAQEELVGQTVIAT